MDPNMAASPNRPRPGTRPELQDAVAEPATQALIARIDQLTRDAFHLRESEQWDDMLAMAEKGRAWRSRLTIVRALRAQLPSALLSAT
jgi:hypothetical protein